MTPRLPHPNDPGHAGTLRRLRTGLIGLLVIVLAGTAGYVGFGFGVLDALFQTVITITTVGFGEVHRFGPGEMIFTIGLIVAGVGTAAFTFSLLIETFVEGYLTDTLGRRRMERRIRDMQGHVILCGWGRVGRSIADHLRASQTDVVVVDSSLERLSGFEGLFVAGDATDEDVLRSAGIDRARVLVTALNTDADNLYVTLTSRSMCPGLLIVSRAASQAAVPKLLRAGADRVVNPQDLGGTRMAALAVQPAVADFLDVVMHDGSLEFRLEQIGVPSASPIVGESLRGARVHARTGALVLALRHPGEEFTTNPPPEAEVGSGDILVVIGNSNQIAALRTLVGSGEGAVGSAPE